MKILGIIPSRYASSRFPGKPLVDILGKPMIWRVYEQASKADCFHKIVVATDDQKIFDAVADRGGRVLMTSEKHRNGTERCVEALKKVGEDFDYVINIQGDEPFIQPEPLEELAQLLDGNVELGTMVGPITKYEELINPGVVKVIFNKHYEALYFSRHPIPYVRDVETSKWIQKYTFYKHISIYAYRTDVLGDVANLDMSNLERAESLEQLRWIENGYKIKLGITGYTSISIDTPEDLERALLIYGNKA